MPKLAKTKIKLNEKIKNPNGPPFTIYGMWPFKHVPSKNTSYIMYVEALV
jgi:hypothetical protein